MTKKPYGSGRNKQFWLCVSEQAIALARKLALDRKMTIKDFIDEVLEGYKKKHEKCQ
jgi:hypothetical protein